MSANNFHHQNKSRVYFALFLGMATFVTLLLSYGLWSGYKAAVSEAELSTRNLSATLETRLEQVLARTESLLEVQAKDIPLLALQQSAVSANKEKISRQMRRLLLEFPDISGSYIFDARGDLLYTSDKSAKAANVADRPFFKKLRSEKTNQIVFSDSLIARTTGRWSIVIARGIRDEQGKFMGVTTALFDLTHEEKQLQFLVEGTHGSAVIRRSDTGKLVMRVPFSEDEINKKISVLHPIFQFIEAGNSAGTLSFRSLYDKVERMVSFNKLKRYPFVVQVGLAKKDYLANWYKQVYWVLGLDLVFIALMAWVMKRLLRAEIREMETIGHLVKSEARYNTIFTKAKSPMLLIDPANGYIAEGNQAAYDYYGYAQGTLEGVPMSSINTLPNKLIAEEMKLAEQEKRTSFNFKHRLWSGEVRDVEVYSGPIDVGGQHLLLSIIHDITERKNLEQSQIIDHRRMADILWGTGVGTWEWNVQTGEAHFNERWAELIGYTLEELAPISIETWVKFAHPDDLAASTAALEKYFRRETLAYEFESRMRHKDGHWVWVLDRGRVNTWTEAGKPLWMAGTHFDITQRKEAEIALKEKTVALAHSNAELEQFSYSISHDMRQPLRMISSYLKLLEMNLGAQLNEEQRSYFNFAVDGAKRMDGMMVGLLEYSRVGRKGEPSAWTDSQKILNEVLLFLQPAREEAQAEILIEGEWPLAFVSPDEMLRLLQNLIANALKFRIEGRHPKVVVASSVEDNIWRVSVTDNGIGIAADQSHRLFQVFQRLQNKSAYEGSGVGLALCRKIIEHHGGKIWVESAGEGQGSRFIFEILLTRDVSAEIER